LQDVETLISITGLLVKELGFKLGRWGRLMVLFKPCMVPVLSQVWERLKYQLSYPSLKLSRVRLSGVGLYLNQTAATVVHP
jgi:hypothetical protein